MGRTFERKGKKGTTWYIEYYYQGKQYREKVGREKDGITKRMAKEALQSREGDKAKKKFDIAQTKTHPLFNQAIDEYLELKKYSRRDDISLNHLKPFFKHKRIDEINTLMIERYKKSRKEEITGKEKNKKKEERDISFVSINRELALLKHFYSMNIKWGKIDKNPVKGVKMFPEKARERYFDEEEIQSLLKACEASDNQSLKAITLTALNTGTRLQETLNLKVSDLDFKNSIIYLEHTKNGDKGKVPMSDHLREVLTEHIEDKNKSEYLFCNKDGKPFKNIRTAFKTALKRAGIADGRFHDLRHTFASHLTMNGVEGITLQQLGRWKTPSMVSRYAHLSPAHKKSAVDTLGNLFKNKDKTSTNLIEGDFARGARNE